MQGVSNNIHQRIDYIDIAKGFLILLVVLGHMMTTGIAHDIIYSFHLFAFVFISGVLYKRRDTWKEYIKRDCLKLCISYAFYAVIWILFDYLWALFGAGGGTTETSFISAAWAVLLGNGNIVGVSLGAIWYLPMLITIKLLARVIDVIVKGNPYLYMGISFLLMICGVFLLNGINDTPWFISSACSSLFFFFLGHIWFEKDGPRRYSKTKLLILVFLSAVEIILLCFLVYISGSANLGNNTYSNPFLVPVNALIGISLIINISLITDSFLQGKISLLVKKPLIYLGVNSLHIMGWHSEIRVVLYYLLESLPGILKFVLVFVLTIVLCIPLNYVSKRLLSINKHSKTTISTS